MSVDIPTMARNLGLDYDQIPEVMTPGMAATLLKGGLCLKNILWIAMQGDNPRLPCRRVTVLPGRSYILIHRDDLIYWAANRKKGRPRRDEKREFPRTGFAVENKTTDDLTERQAIP